MPDHTGNLFEFWGTSTFARLHLTAQSVASYQSMIWNRFYSPEDLSPDRIYSWTFQNRGFVPTSMKTQWGTDADFDHLVAFPFSPNSIFDLYALKTARLLKEVGIPLILIDSAASFLKDPLARAYLDAQSEHYAKLFASQTITTRVSIDQILNGDDDFADNLHLGILGTRKATAYLLPLLNKYTN